MNPETLKRLMNQIDHLEDHVNITLSICRELGEWCSLYPLECLSKIRLMKFIVECEINGFPEDKLYGLKQYLENESTE